MGFQRGYCKRGMKMLHKHLGELRGTVLAFGGPYSNLQALQALEKTALNWNIAQSQIICTGDVVAYCGDPEGTLKLIRNTDYAVIAGNCEKQFAADANECGCGFTPGSQCSIYSEQWWPYADAYVTEKDRHWMANLPDIISFFHQGRRYAVIHGGITDISRFIWSVSPDTDFTEEFAAIETLIGPVDAVIAGHSGIPFIREIAGKTWINTGAIGMPPHDGNPSTRFILISDSPEIHQLDYDWRAAQNDMQMAGLTSGYDTALETGIWPSEGILPPELRR